MISLLIGFDLKIAVLERLSVRTSQDRQQHAIFEAARPGGIPFDVKEFRELGAWPVLKHIEPPGVERAGGHVIWHDVQEHPHVVLMQDVDQTLEVSFAAELRIQSKRIRDVVAMCAARACRHNRRAVEIADAEPAQVRHNLRRVREAELGSELDAVR